MSTPYEQIAFAAELNDDLPQVDLHGMSAHEARYALEHAVSGAFMQGAEAMRIIHGRGDGTLRRTIHEELQKHANLVAYFRDATNIGQVGGMTIAVLHAR
jgi:dsDNA-specific endonuclease/ATPase MutS2